MGTVFPDWRYPDIGDEAQTNVLRPTMAAGIQGMASITNHLIAMRAKRAAHHRSEYPRDLSSGNYSIQFDSPVGITDTHRLWWRSHQLSTAILVTVVYQATRDLEQISAASVVSIEAVLKNKTSGAIIDSPDGITGANPTGAGIVWNAVNGMTFGGPVRTRVLSVDGTSGPVNSYPFQMAHTGQMIYASVSAPFPTAPRPMLIPATSRGAWLLLELIATNVRLISADVWELPVSATVF